jgi:signal transduction histidine kinase
MVIDSRRGDENGDKIHASPNLSPYSDVSTHVPEFFPESDPLEDLAECSEVEEDVAGSNLQGSGKNLPTIGAHDARKQVLQEMLTEAKQLYQSADPNIRDCEDLLDRMLREVKTIYLEMYGNTAELEQEFSDYVQREYLAWLRAAMDSELPKRKHLNHGLGLAAQSRQEMLEDMLEEVRILHLESPPSDKHAREERLQEMLRDVIEMYLDMYGRTDATFSEVSDHVAYLWDACRWPRALRGLRA